MNILLNNLLIWPFLAFLLSPFSLLTSARRLILIRHGEEPPANAPNPNDLSAAGIARSKCIINVFASGANKPEYIFAQTPDNDLGVYDRIRPLQTVQPLADYLKLQPHPKTALQQPPGYSGNVDTSVDRDKPTDLVTAIASVVPDNATVLVCWEHLTMDAIAVALGIPGAHSIDKNEFDQMWIVDTATKSMTVEYEGCNHGFVAREKPKVQLVISVCVALVLAMSCC